MKTFSLRLLCILLACAAVASAQEVIPLYPGIAPGSAPADYPEKQYFSKAWNTEVVTNVTPPHADCLQAFGGNQEWKRHRHLPRRRFYGAVDRK